MKGAAILAKTLEEMGVEYVFGLSGSTILGCLDAIAESDVSFVTTRHEQVATSMATGYAMATRKPTGVISHVGPGAANQILGLAAAYRDNVPVVSITGNEPSYRLGKDVRHEWDVLGIFEKFTKHSVRVGPDRPGEQIRNAIVRSVTAMPGPVHIDFPRDLEEKELPEPNTKHFDRVNTRTTRFSSGLHQPSEPIETALDLLADSNMPLIIAGNEFRWFGGEDELRTFVERTGIPVATSKNARGTLPESHELSLGPVGRPGEKPTNEYLKEADLVIGLGSRFSDLDTSNWELIDEDASIVHVTIREGELNRQYLSNVNVLSDPKTFLLKVNDLVDDGKHDVSFNKQSMEVHGEVRRVKEEFLKTTKTEGEGVDPRLVLEEVNKQAEKYSFTTGGGVHNKFPQRNDVDDLDDYFVTSNFSGMSQGLPLAMGAQIALDNQMIVFEGDGGVMMVIQDLETAVREQLPVKIIVLNNNAYMAQLVRQEKYYGGRGTGSVYSNPDFAELAESFGMFGATVETNSEVEAAVSDLLAEDGPGLLDVNVEKWIGTGGYDRD